ncbi:MAG: hypothetical protein PHP41_04250 [Bacilli bacterium]|jgi:hypothetical protein|nr:hypothetical protein [Bacilli bacterium]
MFIVFSFDSFSSDNPFLTNLLAFLIHSGFGWILLAATFLLRKRSLLLGGFYLAGACFFFFFFDVYKNIGKHLYVFLIFVTPLLLGGVIHIVSASKEKKGKGISLA